VTEHFLEEARSGEAAYCVVPSEAMTLRRLAELAQEVSGERAPVIVAEEAKAPEHTCGDEWLLARLPEMRFTSIEDGVARLYAHYAANMASIDPSLLLIDK